METPVLRSIPPVISFRSSVGLVLCVVKGAENFLLPLPVEAVSNVMDLGNQSILILENFLSVMDSWNSSGAMLYFLKIFVDFKNGNVAVMTFIVSFSLGCQRKMNYIHTTSEH